MKTNATLTPLVLAALLAGCASVPDDAPRFSPAPPAPEGYATLYLYRYGAPPFTQAIKLLIAGGNVLEVPERAYTWVHVKAGTHNVEAQWPRPWPSTSTTRTFEAGQPYYIRLIGRVGGETPSFFSSGIKLTSLILSVEPAVGTAELVACCKYLKPAAERIQ